MDKDDGIELGRWRGSGKKTDGRQLRGGKVTGEDENKMVAEGK